MLARDWIIFGSFGKLIKVGAIHVERFQVVTEVRQFIAHHFGNVLVVTVGFDTPKIEPGSSPPA